MTEKWEAKIGTPYEITICPDDKHQYAGKKDSRLRAVSNDYKELLLDCGAMYHLFCEVSMPQAGDLNKSTLARVHFHGVILFPKNEDILRFYLTYWHRLTKTARIQLNPFRPEWDNYCRKQSAIIQKQYRIKSCLWADIVSFSAPDPSAPQDQRSAETSVAHVSA